MRKLALLAAASLFLLAFKSELPWLAASVTIVLLGLVYFGWMPSEGWLARRDPARRPRALVEERLSALLDAIVSPAILIDHRGNIVRTNLVARDSFAGLRNGHPFSFAIRAPAIGTALSELLASAEETRAEFVERIPVERSFSVLMRRLAGARAVDGAPFALILFTETTAARRIETMRGDFVANASHELRTPLASILGFIETLQGPARNDEAARRNFLTIMERQARRMSRLIDDLLSLSRIEMKAHILPSDRIDLALVLRSVCDAMGGLARDRSVTIDASFPEGQDFSTIGDRDELVRVFENLIENATKYGQSGGKVDLALSRMTDGVIGPAIAVTVRDYGPGIAEEHLPRLTERFYRVDAGESRMQGGTGLGLAIVKHIVSRHRGRLVLRSKPGEGLEAVVILPAIQTKNKLKTIA
ncbi:MAG TPA: ATP-binding protein [Rhabdaerophilum sp.]|nr:ATP-binding protein [Rhabdaerophilum sp.]